MSIVDVTISNALAEWAKWEEKLLMFSEVESTTSNALKNKLSGESCITDMISSCN